MAASTRAPRALRVGGSRVALAALVALSLAGCGLPFDRKPLDQWITEPSQGSALVCILFPSGGGWGGNSAQLFIEEGSDDRFLATLFPGTHFMLELAPGEYLFEVAGDTLDLMRATVEAGEIYHAAIGTYFAPGGFGRSYGHYTFEPINDPANEKLPVWLSESAEIEPTAAGKKAGAAHKKRLAKLKPVYKPRWEAKEDPQHLYVPTPHAMPAR